MKIQIEKDVFSERISIASRFTSNKVSSVAGLQGILLKIEETTLTMHATNLNTFYETNIVIEKVEEKRNIIIEPKKILEFLAFLPSGKLELTFTEKQFRIQMGKTKGNFPITQGEDFPFPPEMKDKPVKLEGSFFQNELPLVLFSASADDTRPVLTGINFISSENELLMAATDGFRLSILREKKQVDVPSMIVAADFLEEVLRYLKEEKEILFSYSAEEKMVCFASANASEKESVASYHKFYTRLIEGDYPPFERVIPAETKTTITMDRAEFQRNIKLISVFAREFSNVVVCEFSAEGVTIRPKKEGNAENTAFQESTMEGDAMTVAFNFRFVLDVLNNIGGKDVVIELLRPDAPVVFKTLDHSAFLHVIMPIRVQE